MVGAPHHTLNAYQQSGQISPERPLVCLLAMCFAQLNSSGNVGMGKSEAEGACMRGRVGMNASMCVVRDIKKRGAELNSAGVLMEAN